ncbi:MAG: response regulator [Planctomycetaceae bacterium]|jgi:signal transduction histidine kinase/CheY-like chemotaxis protein|nr:response regulator [Planctomycetaceae bacterium]
MSDSIHITPTAFSQDILSSPPPPEITPLLGGQANTGNTNKVSSQRGLFTIFMIVWTVFFIFVSIGFYVCIDRVYVYQLYSRAELADSVLSVYHQWFFNSGGIYSHHSEDGYFQNLPRQEIKTADGSKMYLIDSTTLIRNINGLSKLKDSGISFKLTSIAPDNPKNKADDWELSAIKRLSSGGLDKVFAIDNSGEHTTARLAMPIFVTKNCVACHTKLTAKEGDMHGIISTSVNSDTLSYYRFILFCVGYITITCIWLSGFVCLTYLRHREEQHVQALTSLVAKEAAINKYRTQLEELVAERTADLREAVRSVELANTAKSQFLAHMSHEIRTPLTGVLGLTNLLANEQLTDKQSEYVKMICLSGETLLSLINDILDFSKIEAGKLELDRREFDLFDKIESLFSIMSTRFMDKELELCLDVLPGVPRIVVGDGSRLLQILINIAGNSVKFTTKGGVRISVACLELQRDNNALIRFRIADTGIGIEKNNLSRLFKSYSQADSSIASKFGGTGLGLMISKHLIRMMGGDITVTSESGIGTTFEFNVIMGVPVEQVTLMWDNPVPSITSMRDLPSVENINVLLIADNMVVRESLKTQLEYWKMRVSVVSTREEIEAKLYSSNAEDTVQLILWDEGFTQLEIVDYIGRIRGTESTANIPVVLLVMMVDSIDAVLAQVLKMVTVKKPFCVSALYDAILSALFKQSVQGFFTKKDSDRQEAKNKSHIVRQLKFLIAEDNVVNQVVITGMLRSCGHSCEVVANGELAVDKFRNDDSFDIILMDCQMPVMDGYEATKLIRESEAENEEETGKKIRPIPIIALTANATVEDRTKCIDCGMDDFCSKPVKQEVLFALVNKLLNNNSTTN